MYLSPPLQRFLNFLFIPCLTSLPPLYFLEPCLSAILSFPTQYYIFLFYPSFTHSLFLHFLCVSYPPSLFSLPLFPVSFVPAHLIHSLCILSIHRTTKMTRSIQELITRMTDADQLLNVTKQDLNGTEKMLESARKEVKEKVIRFLNVIVCFHLITLCHIFYLFK